MSDHPIETKTVITLGFVQFPRGAKLWNVLDAEGLKQQILVHHSKKKQWQLPLLQPIEIQIEHTRSKYPTLRHAEFLLEGFFLSPQAYALTVWLAELVHIGLQSGDPHAELFILLKDFWQRHRGNVTSQEAGQLSSEILRLYGIWFTPSYCPKCGALPDGKVSAQLGCSNCYPLLKMVTATQIGPWFISLYAWLKHIENLYAENFSAKVLSTQLVVDMGKKGLFASVVD